MNNLNYVIVTGSTGNLGGKICAHLIKCGYGVIISSRSKIVLKQTEKSLSAIRKNAVKGYILDLEDKTSISKFYHKVKLLPIVSLINNAALDNVQLIKNLSYESIESVMKVNFLGQAYLSKLVLEKWVYNSIPGRIINISSLLSIFGSEKSSAYSASKAALEAFCRNVVSEYAQYGITCNIIRIAATGGNLIAEKQKSRFISYKKFLSQNEKNNKKFIPARRLLKIEEILEMIDLLLANCTFLNGQAINLDGGISIQYPNYKI